MRRVWFWLALGVGLAAILPVASAGAASVVTWTTTSAYVDPSQPTFNGTLVSPPPSLLPVDVYLPDGYDGSRRFPVLYLLHGHGDNYASWLSPKDGDLLQIAKGSPAIVVMPEGDQGWYTNWWRGGARGGPAWERYHLDELIPLVERRLRILPGRASHAIAGLSMGGEGALYYAEQRPGYFGAAASFSGSISIQRPEWPTGFNTQGQDYTTLYGDQHGFYATGHNPAALAGNLRYTRTFIRVGDGIPNPVSLNEVKNTFGQVAELELRQHAVDFVSAAGAAGVDVTYQPHQGIHDWPYWRADLAAALQWGFFRPVDEHPASWRYQTVAQHALAWGYALDFARPPAALETFSFDRCTLSASGSGTLTVTGPTEARFRASVPFRRHLADCPAPARRPAVRPRHRPARRRPHHRPARRHRPHAAPRFTG